MDELIKAYLALATQALTLKSSARSERSADHYDTKANAYFMAAWMAAGYPVESNEWPSFAVWSARKLMELDSDDAMYCEDVGAGS